MKDNSDRPNDESRADALAATRRRFLKMTGTALGASLAATGFGFVAAKDALAIGVRSGAEGLVLPIPGMHERVTTFVSKLLHDRSLQDSFSQNPMATLVKYGVTPNATAATISASNALFFYLVSNRELQQEVASAATSFPSIHAALNSYTARNVNITSVESVESEDYSYTSAIDFRQSLDSQIQILIRDIRVQQLLGIRLDSPQQAQFASSLSNKLTAIAQTHNAQKRSNAHVVSPQRSYLAVFNFNFVANANYQYNANFSANFNFVSNANASLNFNANAATYVNYDGANSVLDYGLDPLDDSSASSRSQRELLKRLCDSLSAHAEGFSQR